MKDESQSAFHTNQGAEMPLLVYVSREKSTASPNHFKAGALNVLVINSCMHAFFPYHIYLSIYQSTTRYICYLLLLQLRVSSIISNSPYILVLDCDMRCNDPTSALQAMCFHLDPKISSNLAFVQFPQMFHNLSKMDIYDGQLRSIFLVKSLKASTVRHILVHNLCIMYICTNSCWMNTVLMTNSLISIIGEVAWDGWIARTNVIWNWLLHEAKGVVWRYSTRR